MSSFSALFATPARALNRSTEDFSDGDEEDEDPADPVNPVVGPLLTKKPLNNQALLDRLDSLTNALIAPKPITTALEHFNTVLGAHFVYRDKIKVLPELFLLNCCNLESLNCTFSLLLSDVHKHKWESEILGI
jgi:hypothetical protein